MQLEGVTDMKMEDKVLTGIYGGISGWHNARGVDQQVLEQLKLLGRESSSL
jgi:hypothetical protein